ncbi:MAG: hypothetical protein AAB368_11190, partial [bacterium]
FTPLSPQAQLAGISILGMTLLVLTILSHVRRKPPLDSELVKLALAIEGLQKSVDVLTDAERTHATHAVEISALQHQVQELEGYREDDQKSSRTYIRETTHEIFGKIDDLKDSLNANLRMVERAVGQVEGKVERLAEQIDRTRPPLT